jgi:flagellar biosynthesis protein FlhG
MNDQAKVLRQLVRHEAGSHRPQSHDGPQLVMVTAGKGGVGTTTVAVNLAVALAQAGSNCVLVDGNAVSGDATTLCGLDTDWDMSHVAAGWRSVEESLVDGPGGVRVLPGGWGLPGDPVWSETAQARLIDGLKALSSAADFVVIDAGSGLGPAVGGFWRAANLVLIVTTPDALSIMDAYAAIKVHSEGAAVPVRTLVNRAADIQSADDVHARLARACQRFLGLTVMDAGYLPIIHHETASPIEVGPFVLSAPDATATLCIQRLAQSMAGQRRPRSPAFQRSVAIHPA